MSTRELWYNGEKTIKEAVTPWIYNIDMTYLMPYGYNLIPICPVNGDSGAVSQKTIAYLSMLYFGFCEQVRRDEIYRPLMESGALFISDFAVDAIKEHGKSYLKFW